MPCEIDWNQNTNNDWVGLRRDVETAEGAVLRLIRVPLEDGRFDALGSFTFNLGAGAPQRSTLRRQVNRQEHGAVPREFRRRVWAGGRKLEGLIRRREAEAELSARRRAVEVDHPRTTSCHAKQTVSPLLR